MAAKKAKEYLHIFAEGTLSFFALLLSIFIYFSFFNLSLSSDLFHHTKFWFCLSNTLILIIAASDYRASSPSEPKPENKDYMSNPKQAKEVAMVVLEKENQEEKLKIISDEGKKKTKVSSKTYRRSKSDKAKKTMVDEKEGKIISMRRSRTMKQEAKKDYYYSEENVFAEMTDEELNKRVEEFIQRFNKQIQLQVIEYGDEV